MTAVHPWEHEPADEDGAVTAGGVDAMQDRLRRLPRPSPGDDGPGLPGREAAHAAMPGAMLFVGAAGAAPTINYF